MSGISDNIEKFIIQMLRETNKIRLQRNELANYFGCSPSQINYVLTTRFSLERGYIIESKRGGGGFICVCKIDLKSCEIGDVVSTQIGEEISQQKAKAIIQMLHENCLISKREKQLMDIASASYSSSEYKNNCDRAKILRLMCCSLIQTN